MAKKEPVGWITVNGQHVPLFEGESKQDAYTRAVVKHNEDVKEKQIAKQKAEADKLNVDGKVINGKFYTTKELKNMSLEQLREIMGTKTSDKSSDKSSSGYSFSDNNKLSSVEKDWLEQSVDWVKGDDNLPMVGLNTIARYYGVDFGKSSSIISNIDDKGDATFKSMNKTLINQAFNNIEKLKAAIRQKEGIK